jgi:SAM-dependent methyltransferase
MRREALFSRSGFYRFLLDTNALMHREARAAARRVLVELHAAAPGRALRVLDLACGGWPLSIAEAMGSCVDQCFDYTGVDINPDQVESARSLFRFPETVTQVRILEGNAWDLDPLGLEPGFDLVFSGLNLHHGTPEEIAFLARELLRLLEPGGRFLSHDVYRPESADYRRRPACNPSNTSESFRLLAPQQLAAAGIPDLKLAVDSGSKEPAWRTDYLQKMHRLLLERGADSVGAESTVAHMRQRDYPVSLGELRGILEALGFVVETGRYQGSEHPLAPYLGWALAMAPIR